MGKKKKGYVDGNGGESQSAVVDVAKRNAENLLAWMKNESPRKVNKLPPAPAPASDSDSDFSFDLSLSCDVEEHSSDEEHEQAINLRVERYLASQSILLTSENEESCGEAEDLESDRSTDSSDSLSTSSETEERDYEDLYFTDNFLIEQKPFVLATEECWNPVIVSVVSLASEVAVSNSDEEADKCAISNRSNFTPESSPPPHISASCVSEEETSEDELRSDWVKCEPDEDDVFDAPSPVPTINLADSDNEEVKEAETEAKAQEDQGKSPLSNHQYNLRYGYEKLHHTPARKRNYEYRKEEWECPLCQKKLKYASRFLHLQKLHKGIRHLCTICNKGFKRKITLKSHRIEAHPGEISKIYSCLYCSVSFKKRDTLDRHVKLIHPKTRKHHHYKCLMCNEIFLNNKKLGEHYKVHLSINGETYKCRLCDQTYKASSALRSHMLTRHNPTGDLPFKCNVCDYSAVSNFKIRQHKLIHGDKENTRLQSKHCRTIRTCSHIASQGDLNTKELTSCDQCGLVCSFCVGAFRTKQQFLLHSHKLCCGICKLRFQSGRDFQYHVAYHEDPAVICYRCDICKFGFTTVARLNIHSVKVHNLKMSMSSYKCLTCNKTFSKRHLLSIHAQTHSKHIKCPWCDKKFSTITNRDHHMMRVHTMERPYRCQAQDCKSAFVRKSDLLRHTREVHSSHEITDEASQLTELI